MAPNLLTPRTHSCSRAKHVTWRSVTVVWIKLALPIFFFPSFPEQYIRNPEFVQRKIVLFPYFPQTSCQTSTHKMYVGRNKRKEIAQKEPFHSQNVRRHGKERREILGCANLNPLDFRNHDRVWVERQHGAAVGDRDRRVPRRSFWPHLPHMERRLGRSVC
jgi:hypothetical protein